MRYFYILLAISILSTSKVAATTNTSVGIVPIKMQSNTYEIGYQLGDIAYQTINIITPKGYQFDESSLPAKGKGATNMELRNATWHKHNIGNSSQHVIQLEWQIFRVMQETRSYSLKPLDLKFRPKIASQKALTVHVNAARVLVSSVLPTSMDEAHIKPRLDAMPQPRNTGPIVLTLCLAVVGFLLSMLYFAWHFDWLPARLTALFVEPKPFRKAYREIKHLKKEVKGNVDTSAQLTKAMCVLRRACDASAGTTLSLERIGLLFANNGKYAAKRAEIESFYAESERTFFAGNSSSYTLFQLSQLSRQLMKLETGS